MQSYLHPNSSSLPPVLSGDTLRLYRQARDGQPAVIPTGHYAGETLRLVAERIECDQAHAQLARLGVDSQIVSREADYLPDGGYYEAAIRIGDHAIDAAAARRVAQRIEAGLSSSEALSRTLLQCDQPVHSASALRDLEREADAHVARILTADKGR